MAITLQAQPTSPVYAYSDLVYTITSDNISNAGFSFVVDIYDGTTLVERLFKQPNQSGIGRFGIQKILQSDLEFNDAPLSATTNVVDTIGSKTYTIRFGEEYLVGTTLTVFPNAEAAGQTANTLTAIKGFRPRNEGTLLGSHSFPTILSNIPMMGSRVHRGDSLSVTYFDTTTNQVRHQGIIIPSTADSVGGAINGVNYLFTVYDERSRLGEERFAYYNRNYGLDYLTCDQESFGIDNVTRRSANSSTVDYERSVTSSRSITNDNVFRSGSTIYGVDYSEVFTSNTPWLENIGEYNNAKSIILSPIVWKSLDNGLWAEVEILTDTLPSYPNLRQTQNFNLTFDWKYATPKTSY